MDIDEARHWATLNEEVCDNIVSAATVIRCARLAVAEHERAETEVARVRELKRTLVLAGPGWWCSKCEQEAAQRTAMRPGYWWCPECKQEVDESRVLADEHDCGAECEWIEPKAETEDDPVGSVWEFIGNTSANGRRWQKVEPRPEPDEQQILAASRVYRRALFAIHELRQLLTAMERGYPRSRGNVGDILGRLGLFAESVATDLPGLLARSERQNVEMVIEGRDRQGEVERLQIALMIEDWLGGEAGAALAALIRGCFHWSEEFSVEEL